MVSVMGLTCVAARSADASRRASRGHRSSGQLSSSAMDGPVIAADRPFCAAAATSATCILHMQGFASINFIHARSHRNCKLVLANCQAGSTAHLCLKASASFKLNGTRCQKCSRPVALLKRAFCCAALAMSASTSASAPCTSALVSHPASGTSAWCRPARYSSSTSAFTLRASMGRVACAKSMLVLVREQKSLIQCSEVMTDNDRG